MQKCQVDKKVSRFENNAELPVLNKRHDKHVNIQNKVTLLNSATFLSQNRSNFTK